MNTTLKVIFIVLGTIFAVILLVGAGMVIGRFAFGSSGWWMPMHGFTQGSSFVFDRNSGPGMMQGSFEQRDGYGVCPNEGRFAFGRGMMGRWGVSNETCGGFQEVGPGMMWNTTPQGSRNTDPISVEDAKAAVNDFLASYGNDDLVLAEIMVFDNHAYAEIVEESTGIGAMEVLIDPETLYVYPEHGPNMMWNQKYSQMGHGMMGGYYRSDETPETMTVTPEEAVQKAQAYLDRYESGLKVEDHADLFYGYYTLHTSLGGETVGMLSVNGYSGDVFMHTWHGDFIEMVEYE